MTPQLDDDPLDGCRDVWLAAWTDDPVDAMTRTYCRHFEAVLRRARNVCSTDDAADVAQEVFLRLWKAPHAFDPAKGSLRTYLLVLTRGIAIDHVRRDVRRRARDERAIGPNASLDDGVVLEPLLARESAERVRRALELIHPTQRDAVRHVYFDGLTFGDSARRACVPESTVKSRVRLALRHLHPELVDLATSDAGNVGTVGSVGNVGTVGSVGTVGNVA